MKHFIFFSPLCLSNCLVIFLSSSSIYSFLHFFPLHSHSTLFTLSSISLSTSLRIFSLYFISLLFARCSYTSWYVKTKLSFLKILVCYNSYKTRFSVEVFMDHINERVINGSYLWTNRELGSLINGLDLN